MRWLPSLFSACKALQAAKAGWRIEKDRLYDSAILQSCRTLVHAVKVVLVDDRDRAVDLTRHALPVQRTDRRHNTQIRLLIDTLRNRKDLVAIGDSKVLRFLNVKAADQDLALHTGCLDRFHSAFCLIALSSLPHLVM